MSRLVFIEGISGAGKSTLARALFEKLRGLGYQARCFLEGDSDSPLDLFYASYLTRVQYTELLRAHPDLADELSRRSVIEADYALVRYQSAAKKTHFPRELHQYLKEHEFCFHPANPLPLPEYEKVFLNLWRLFAENEKRNKNVLVFDGSLFHHQINDLMRNYNASEGQIAAHIGALARAVASLNPVVFYLSARDAIGQLTKARKDRGQAPPTAEQIAFWQRRKEIDLAVLESLPIEPRVIDFTDCGNDIMLESIVPSVVDRKMEEAH